jgi:hypothetical protein
MNERRLRLDDFAYGFALGALALLSLAFLSARNGAALIMCGLVFAGLVVARMADFSSRTLVPVALGLVAILWMVWIDPPSASVHKISAAAHAGGGALVGWALSQYLRPRRAWPLWAVAALAVAFAITLVWELGELAGDRLLDTALIPNARDSAADVFFGTMGASAGIFVAALLPGRRATG